MRIRNPVLEGRCDRPAVLPHHQRQLVHEESDRHEFKPLGKYPAKCHARKVAKQMGVNSGVIYLEALPKQTFEDSDQGPRFRQRRYFYYITGVDLPGCAVTYDIAQDVLSLYLPKVPPREAMYGAPSLSPSQAKSLYDIDQAYPLSDLDGPFFNHFSVPPCFRTSLEGVLYVLHKDQAPAQPGRMSINVGLLQRAMDRARVIKTPHEIELIRRANSISSAAHRKTAEHLLSMSNEREIEAMQLAVCTFRGARTQAYPIIAGSGENAARLHYDSNNQPFGDRQLVVVDAGCEVDCYASDITRTLPLGGRFEGKAKQIHSLVEAMQEASIAAVRPGMLFVQLHRLAANIALDGLLSLGILQGDRAEIQKMGTITAFFPHGLGHHIGLEVHDVSGDYPLMMSDVGKRSGKRSHVDSLTHGLLMTSILSSRPLEPNMVVTIEPGIYFCREYIELVYLNSPGHAKFINRDVLEEYYPVGGVRIEDDILVTESGYENLTTAPKGKELEETIQNGSKRPW